MASRAIGLLLLLAGVLVAALLSVPGQAEAENEYCPAVGIVPGSVSVVSSSNAAGHVAAHVVQFQLCGGFDRLTISDVQGNKVGPPDKIGLLWQGFSITDPNRAGVLLSVSNGSRSWPATTEISNRGGFRGLAVEFTPAQLSALDKASAEFPLNLQFNIPITAGMVNPEDIGGYRWAVELFHVLNSSCEARLGDFVSRIVPAYQPGQLQLFPNYGEPGATTTVVGQGLKPLTAIRSIKFGDADLTPNYDVTTNFFGDFELEVLVPGLVSGRQPIAIEVNGQTANAEFSLINPGVISGPPDIRWSIEPLGTNLVSLFHYNRDTLCWSFYDPELPEESELRYLITGERYWILVREPVEVVLNNVTRRLTCTPEGNCWNQIVW